MIKNPILVILESLDANTLFVLTTKDNLKILIQNPMLELFLVTLLLVIHKESISIKELSSG